MINETKQAGYLILRSRSTSDDTDLVFSGGSSTCEYGDKSSSIKFVPAGVNAVQVIFVGSDEDDETMTWAIYAYRAKGPAEKVANGTATLGTQRVEKATATILYADTIAITEQVWATPLSVCDSANNRIAKLSFDFCGYEGLYCVMTKNSSAASIGAYCSYF